MPSKPEQQFAQLNLMPFLCALPFSLGAIISIRRARNILVLVATSPIIENEHHEDYQHFSEDLIVQSLVSNDLVRYLLENYISAIREKSF